MAATRFLGDRTRILATWGPRCPWDSSWAQGYYGLVFYDTKRAREIWQPPMREKMAPRFTTRRSFELHIQVLRGAHREGSDWSKVGFWELALTLEELGFPRPEIPFYEDERGRHYYDERDLAPRFSGNERGCRTHEDCQRDRALALHCAAEQLARMRAEDEVRAKLLGTPKAIDTVVRLVLSKIARAPREELGRLWLDTEGVREDLAKHGVLMVQRQAPAKRRGV